MERKATSSASASAEPPLAIAKVVSFSSAKAKVLTTVAILLDQQANIH